MSIVDKLIATFDTYSKGFSARKVTAFWFVVLSSYVHYQHLHDNNAVDFLHADIVATLLCLSIISISDIISIRTGTPSKSTEPEPKENV